MALMKRSNPNFVPGPARPVTMKLACRNCGVNVYERYDGDLEHTSTETHYGGWAYRYPGVDAMLVGALISRRDVITMKRSAA